MQSDAAKVKSFSPSKGGKSRIAKATSAAIAQQIEDTRPAILSELGRVCESRGGQLTDEQVAAIAALISHLYHPSEILAQLADWLESNESNRELARDWLKTHVGQQCVANAWYDAETRRDLPKEALIGIMQILDEEAKALGLAHLVSDRLRKQLSRRAEGIQARGKDEPWKDQGISKAGYYRKLATEKAASPTAAIQSESQPWVKLGISRATYFRQKSRETEGKTEHFNSISHSETRSETRTSGSYARASLPSPPSSFLYISGRSSLTSSLTPIAAPITDPIECARARDRGDDYYYYIVASRDISRRLSDLQHLGPDLLTGFVDIENGDYPQAGYMGLWDIKHDISSFPEDLDPEPPPIELMKRLPTSIARQFAHKALQLGMAWEDPAYWDLENPWTWFVIDRRPNADEVHAALRPLAGRFWRALSRTNGIAAAKAKKAARAASAPTARVEFDSATMHPPCCSAEDWATVPLPLRNRALTIAGDLFLRGVWQQMDCLAIGIVGAERAETRRKMLVELCPQATSAEIETAAINCWQIPIWIVPQVAEGLNEHTAERVRIETAHLQPEIIEQMNWIMAQTWADEMMPGGLDLERVRESLARKLAEIGADTWRKEAKESLRQSVRHVRDPRFVPTTWADENKNKALAKREIMTVQATITR